MHIEILYFEGCPNHVPTADLVKRVIADLGVPVNIDEVELTGRGVDRGADQNEGKRNQDIKTIRPHLSRIA